MNPLTQIKNRQELSLKEAMAGRTMTASWHDQFRHSAYIFTGGLPFKLSEGDLLAVFSQYGEIIDVNLVRDKETGKSRGFAFLAYVNQKSTDLAVDNLNGATVGGRTISVDHVLDYKRKKKEMGVEDEGDEANGNGNRNSNSNGKESDLQGGGYRGEARAPERTGKCAEPKQSKAEQFVVLIVCLSTRASLNRVLGGVTNSNSKTNRDARRGGSDGEIQAGAGDSGGERAPWESDLFTALNSAPSSEPSLKASKDDKKEKKRLKKEKKRERKQLKKEKKAAKRAARKAEGQPKAGKASSSDSDDDNDNDDGDDEEEGRIVEDAAQAKAGGAARPSLDAENKTRQDPKPSQGSSAAAAPRRDGGGSEGSQLREPDPRHDTRDRRIRDRDNDEDNGNDDRDRDRDRSRDRHSRDRRLDDRGRRWTDREASQRDRRHDRNDEDSSALPRHRERDRRRRASPSPSPPPSRRHREYRDRRDRSPPRHRERRENTYRSSRD